jgi:hypothetical protein
MSTYVQWVSTMQVRKKTDISIISFTINLFSRIGIAENMLILCWPNIIDSISHISLQMTLKIVAFVELKRSGVIVAVTHNIKLQHTTDQTPSLSHIHNKIISFLYIILVSEWFDLKGWVIWVHKMRYWRASYEDRKVSGHVYVFQWYRIFLFLRLCAQITTLLRRCGIFFQVLFHLW